MACKDSDYTIMIAIMHCPNRTILVLKLTLVVKIQALLLCIWSPLHKRSLRLLLTVQLLGKAHEDSDCTVVIAVVH